MDARMKLLFAAPSFYDEEWVDSQRVRTGQAVMAGELSRNISNQWQKDILVTGYPMQKRKLAYGNLVSTSAWSLIKYVRFPDFRCVAENPKRAKRIVFERALSRMMDNLLKKSNYDMVGIQDFGPGNMELLKRCIARRIRCVVTLHMYVGLGTEINEEIHILRRERERFLFTETDVPITVVSSGMKRRILNDYKHVRPDRITVIPDGTRLPEVNDRSLGKAENDDKLIFLCVGTVGKRKNQLQLLHAIDCLSEPVRKRIRILFIGNDALDGALQREIQAGHYEDAAAYIGSITHEEMAQYYRRAFATISTSLNEAFGLIFIEGFAYGIPAAFFQDTDAVDELYCQDAVELIRGRSDLDIARAITCMVEKKWDSVRIQSHAQAFDIRNIAKEYERMYQKQCARGSFSWMPKRK